MVSIYIYVVLPLAMVVVWSPGQSLLVILQPRVLSYHWPHLVIITNANVIIIIIITIIIVMMTIIIIIININVITCSSSALNRQCGS